MAGIKDISTVWQNIKEVDLKPIRDSATHPVRIALMGKPGVGRHTLAEQMRTDPARPEIHSQSAVEILDLDRSADAPKAHLIIVLTDTTSDKFQELNSLVLKWCDAGKNVLLLVNNFDMVENNKIGNAQPGWRSSRVLMGSVKDISYLQHEFVPAVLELLPQQHLALGRQFPLFRTTIANQLINDTCFSNAAYSFSTGVAQIVPVLDIPLTMTDMIVLTKSQAFLAYKLGLIFGFSTRWQDYVTEFGGVIGGGFIWRQIARQLVGLIPLWGIIPKVAISYSGTYVVGHAILGWYLTGRHLTAKQMRALSTQAFTRGKDYARKLGGKLPKPKLSRPKKDKLPAPMKVPELSEGEIIILHGENTSQLSPTAGVGELTNVSDIEKEIKIKTPISKYRAILQERRKMNRERIRRSKQVESPEVTHQNICVKCGKPSSGDAHFCQYCGNPIEV